MKKIMNFTKIFFVFATIFSQLASPISVLADEVQSNKYDLDIDITEVKDEDNIISSYNIDYVSLNGDYEEKEENGSDDKLYDILINKTFTYLDGSSYVKSESFKDITGEKINTGSKLEVSPISYVYNGTFVLNIRVLDKENKVYYETTRSMIVDSCHKGLVGILNGTITPTTGGVGSGIYKVNAGVVYTQNLMVMPGELSLDTTYVATVTKSDGTVSTPVTLTGKQIFDYVFEGTETDLGGKLGGDYSYTDTIDITDGVNDYTYIYDSTIKYGFDNDELFTDLYGVKFENGKMFVPAKGYDGATSIITVEELLADAGDNEIKVLDKEGNEVTTGEVFNGYTVTFINGAEAEYAVVVVGDNNFDNIFDKKDLLPTIENYLNNENNDSMDVYRGEEDEEEGIITFDDLNLLNDKLNEMEDASSNENLYLDMSLDNKEVFVGDKVTATISVVGEQGDFITGLDLSYAISENLRLEEVLFGTDVIGSYNEEKIALLSGNMGDGFVPVTLVFTALSEGTADIEVIGTSYKSNISDEISLSDSLTIIRNISGNNYLSSLNSNVGEFDVSFDKDVLNYTLTVPSDTESVILSGALEDNYATVKGLIEYTLTDDNTVAEIVVTAEDGTTRTYTVTIVKEKKEVVKPIVYYYSSNNYLKSLEIDGYEIEFDKYTNEYKIRVKSDVKSLDITALPEDSRSRVEITGNESFKTGENVVTITVTAEDGSTREYSVVVNKADDKTIPLDEEEDTNTLEKTVIIILIVLVVLGLLYLIFKKDEEDIEMPVVKNNDVKNNVKKNNSVKNNNTKKKNK